jgi:hypothetical protein
VISRRHQDVALEMRLGSGIEEKLGQVGKILPITLLGPVGQRNSRMRDKNKRKRGLVQAVTL